ncbi:MAG: VanZ family protein [Firmicutes bacterium]|nr:VanZ family protein [Bacillota bacterium]
MALIFFFSNQPANVSEKQSGSILVLLNLIDENEITNDNERIKNLQHIIRKLAHFSIYFILGVLLTLSLKTLNIDKVYIKAFIIGVIYAFSDEFHQYFIPGRGSQLKDVFIDSLGITFGVLIIFILLKKDLLKLNLT